MTKARAKRIRIFAGPNGSGKTTIINAVKANKKVSLGSYINADDIERCLKGPGKLKLSDYSYEIADPEKFYEFANNHGLNLKNKIPDLRVTIKINRKSIVCLQKKMVNSYVAALIADFLREEMLRTLQSFSFETVMSDKRKLDVARRAKASGYRVYLYFVATISPDINIERVSQRVQLGGHNVDTRKIKKRYKGSLSLLYDMIKLTDRAYLFDNSRSQYEQVAEITNGRTLQIKQADIPNWFFRYFYLKAVRRKE